MIWGLLFLPEVVFALGFPVLVIVVVKRIARRRRRSLSAVAGPERRPPLSIPAFASALLWLLPFHAMFGVRWASEKLTWAGVLPGPPSMVVAVVIPVSLTAVGFLLGTFSLYQITRRPGEMRGTVYAHTGILLCWYVGLLLAVGMLPRASAADLPQQLCGENVARLTAALHMYVEDNEGVFPPGENWLDIVLPYLGEGEEGGLTGTPGNCRYAYNAALSQRRLADVAGPAELVAVFEAGPWLSSEEPWANVEGGRQQLPDTPGHRFGDNYGFADGHHQWLPRRSLSAGSRDQGPWAKGTHADWVRWDP